MLNCQFTQSNKSIAQKGQAGLVSLSVSHPDIDISAAAAALAWMSPVAVAVEGRKEGRADWRPPTFD